MDDSNPAITFDENGQCGDCLRAIMRRPHEWWPGPEGKTRMDRLVTKLKRQSQGLPYDAVVGLSGGIDSAYLIHVMRHVYGLRLLAIHVDGGWNTEIAVRNIGLLVRKLDIDLYTYVVEWEEMRDLQLAFLRASVLNQDIPQDHAFFSALYRTVRNFGLRAFLSGGNYSSESIEPRNWGYPAMDGWHVRAIHRRFGRLPLNSFPVMGLMELIWLVRIRRSCAVYRPLDFLPYNREKAKEELARIYGWKDYGVKHTESRFTKFYQEIYLPRKYGYDKRRQHFSSLIVSGQMTREEALAKLAKPIATPEQLRRDIKFVAKKLGLSVLELNVLIDSPSVRHTDYPNQLALHSRLMTLKSAGRRVVRWISGRR
jgi:N-acetyl sugar amidotransferase